jgi:hypothetical protein
MATTLKLHYDGWLALPADLHRKLGLTSGDRLEAELAQGAIVLRPAALAGAWSWNRLCAVCRIRSGATPFSPKRASM